MPTTMPRLLVVALCLVLLATAALTPTPAGAAAHEVAAPQAVVPDPATCEGYPEPRVFMESVAWWQPTLSGSEDFGHVHGGACFPRTHLPDGQVNAVSGTMDLHVRVVLFDNPGTLRYVRVHLTDKDDNRQVARVDIDELCEQGGPRWVTAVGACVWWVPVQVDTRAATYDGFQEFRISANVRQRVGTDDTMFNSTGFQAYVDNGRPVRHYRANPDGSPREFIEGRGWYEGAGYTNARLESRLPYEVSGVWEPSVRMLAGFGGVAVHRSAATLNARLHQGDPGTVLLDHPGEFLGQLRIDTTTLPDGPHQLFLRAHAPCDGTPENDCGLKADGSSMNVSTSTGVLIVTFHTRNGNVGQGAATQGPDHAEDPHERDQPGSHDGGFTCRLAGADRFATAAAIATQTFPARVRRAYVATGMDFPDALAGGAAAARFGGPVLLTDSHHVPDTTVAELQRLEPEDIVVVGGPGVVADAVLQQLREAVGVPVGRIAGADRYDTAARIATDAFRDGAAVVYVATGAGFPDSLAAVPAAAVEGAPLLLVTGDGVPRATAAALEDLSPDKIVVVGGLAAIAQDVVNELATHAPTIRISGGDRYGTAARVAAAAFGPDVDVALVATGATFADALAGGPAAAASGGVLLLVDRDHLPTDTEQQLQRLSPQRLVVLGGSNAVSVDVDQAARRAGGVPTDCG